MIPAPFFSDQVSLVVHFLNDRLGLFYGAGGFFGSFGEEFDGSDLPNQPIAGTSLRGWNGGPFALIHRSGGGLVRVLEDVDLQIDAYGPTVDDAYDVAVFVREQLAAAPGVLDKCVWAQEVVGPMFLPDFEGSMDVARFVANWRLRFRV